MQGEFEKICSGGTVLAGNRSLKMWRKEMNSPQAFLVTVSSKAHIYTPHELQDSTKDQGPSTGPSTRSFPWGGRWLLLKSVLNLRPLPRATLLPSGATRAGECPPSAAGSPHCDPALGAAWHKQWLPSCETALPCFSPTSSSPSSPSAGLWF